MAYAWYAYLFCWVTLAALGLIRAKSKWYTNESALSRLEVQHGLFGQLSAAEAGQAEWPEPQEKRPAVVLRLTQLQGWFLLSLIVFALALFVPIQKGQQTVLAPNIETPPDMATVETWLEVLSDDPAIDPAALEEFEEQLASLEDEESSTWYDQASLEAASALRQNLEHSVNELMEKLDQAQMAVDAASEDAENSVRPMDMGSDAMSALKALPQGAMPWRDAILQRLSESNGQSPMSLSPEAMESLRQSMQRTQNTAQTLSDMGTLRRLTDEELEQLLQQCRACGSPSEGGEDGKDGPGTGGIARGPGTAPLIFQQNEMPFAPEVFEGVSNADLSRASLGETIDTRVVSPNEQETEEIGSSLLEGGSSFSTGSGGAATWQQSLTPAESARLKKFFSRDSDDNSTK